MSYLTSATLDAPGGLRYTRAMTTRERIPQIREQLTARDGVPPTLTQVAQVAGCSREYVRQVYNALGLTTREGQTSRKIVQQARAARKRAKRMAIRHDQQWRDREILEALESLDPDTGTRRSVAVRFGVDPSYVSALARTNGIPPGRPGRPRATS